MPVTINGSAGVTTNSGAVYNGIQSGTAVTASGTSVDFTSIPSWVKRVTVMFNAVSTNGTSHKLVQIGSGSIQTTGYVSSSVITSSTVANSGNITSGMALYTSNATSSAIVHMIFTNISSNIWVESHVGLSDAATSVQGGGVVTLSGTLDRIRITTVNGTDTFDAGSINIMYE